MHTHTHSVEGAVILLRQPVKCSYVRKHLFKQTEVYKEAACSGPTHLRLLENREKEKTKVFSDRKRSNKKSVLPEKKQKKKDY